MLELENNYKLFFDIPIMTNITVVAVIKPQTNAMSALQWSDIATTIYLNLLFVLLNAHLIALEA